MAAGVLASKTGYAQYKPAPASLDADAMPELTTVSAIAVQARRSGGVKSMRLQPTVGFVVGHSVTQTRRITPLYANAVFLIDTGMAFADGAATALEIQDGRVAAIGPDGRTVLVEPQSVR